MIQFLLNNDVVELENPAADLTVLDWLRLQQRLSGTKEGCGSGDCGACTVVLVSASDTPNGLPLTYTPANSCILMMGALQGRQLITVDHLGTPTDLHPAQKALVTHHGSQCGFCTPGFVMSLFAMFHQNFDAQSLLSDTEQRHALIEQYLGGNLCRCTGYRPIVAAADELLHQRFDEKVTDVFDANEPETASQLRAWSAQNSHPNGASNATTVSVYVPKSLSDAMELWSSNPDAEVIAGGTDKGLEVTQQLRPWSSIIHLGDVAELKNIEHHATGLVVGAGVSIAAFLEALTLDFPDAVPMLLRFGSEQVRSQATVGGNLGTASPIGDLPPLLLALNASVDLVSNSKTERGLSTRNVALSDYFTAYRETVRLPNEWIKSIRIPMLSESDALRVYKVSKRMDDDISSVCAAVWVKLNQSVSPMVVDDIRLGFGGMAAIPKRATHTETALKGKPLNSEIVANAMQQVENDFQPIDDARASAQYRLQVARNLLKRFHLEISTQESHTQISDWVSERTL